MPANSRKSAASNSGTSIAGKWPPCAGRRWYLVAWDGDRRDWRTFRVDRMRIRGPAGPPFPPRPLSEAEVADRVTRGLATATWRYRARVTVAAPAARIRRRLPAGIAVEPVGDDTCVAVLGSDSPHWLALHLGMMDADFRIDPAAAPELAGHLRTLAGRYARAAEEPVPLDGSPPSPPGDRPN